MNDLEYQKLKEFYVYVEKQLTLDDYEGILSELEIPIVRKSNGIWYMPSYCHNEIGTKANPNLRFFESGKSFMCFSECNCSYNIFTLIQKVYDTRGKPITSLQSLRIICEYKNIPCDFKAVKTQKKHLCEWKKQLNKYNCLLDEPIVEELQVYDKSILNAFPKIYHTDFLDSGISIETMEKYNIRYYPYKNQIIIPNFNINGELIGIRVKNMLRCENTPKYCPLMTLNGDEYKFPTSSNFYGINFNQERVRQTKEVILVESERSVLIADTYFGCESNVLALYGSSFSKEKREQLIKLGVKKVIIALDFDYYKVKVNGEFTKEFLKFKEKVLKIKKMLDNYVDEIYVVINTKNNTSTYKQCIFDLSKDECLEYLKNKRELKSKKTINPDLR